MTKSEIGRWRTVSLAVGLLTAALLAGLVAAPANAALKHYDGTVVGKNQSASTFRVETQNATVKFKVNGRTKFERISGGLSGLAKGDRVEVDAKQKPSGLVARKVEPQGGGGGANNGGGNGADDPSGDDHGQHGPNHQ
jgi:hypothetical protein